LDVVICGLLVGWTLGELGGLTWGLFAFWFGDFFLFFYFFSKSTQPYLLNVPGCFPVVEIMKRLCLEDKKNTHQI